jgi:hypothetical protein
MEKDKCCACVKLLLVDKSDKKVEVLYDCNSRPFKQPLIGLRSPYYCNPRCEKNYPII